MKVVLAYKNLSAANPVLSHSGLGITAHHGELSLRAAGIPAEAWAVREGYHLWAWLAHRPDITHVVTLAPYLDTPFTERLVRHFSRVRFAMTCHSNVGFLQADRHAVKLLREGLWLQQRVPNFTVGGNSAKFCEWVEQAYGARCALLPNLYHLESADCPHRPLYQDGVLRLGIFGAIRVQKNIMSAAAAALVIARHASAENTEIWVSSDREEGGQGVMAAVKEMLSRIPRIRLVEAGWHGWREFRQLASRMHLMLQPSYTESFNMVTADGVAEGVASVVSSAIDWAPKYWQACADTVLDIARVGRQLLRDPYAAADGYRALQAYNRAGLAAWRAHLA
ncbi:MAG TPA: hypothetical protein VKR61_05755 [Bryobacteraceae bacterium]|nr:hypothetical protein [Bryobacteraceae bacterium]